MRQSGLVGVLACTVAFVATGARAAEAQNEAGERPLLVSVEVEPGAVADAAQVRRAIGSELGRPVLAVAQRDGGTRSGGDPDLMLVNVSHDRIVLSMHRRADETVARDLPLPAERGARLRAIAWLAGNLARDQATPFLVASALDPGAVGPQPAPAVAPPAPPTESPDVDASPRTSAPALRVDGASSAPLGEPTWTVGVSGGFSVAWERLNSVTLRSDMFYVPTAYQIEVVKHRPDGWMWGVGLDVSYDVGTGPGAVALGGFERRWGKLRLDLTAGLGFERATVRTITFSHDGTTGATNATESFSMGYVPYTRALVTVSRQLVPTWDLLFRVGAQHALPIDDGAPFIVMTAIGLRHGLL